MAACLALGSISGQPPALSVLWLILAGALAFAWIPPFWVLPTMLLGESAAATSVGLINAVGNAGGFVGPFAVGYLLSRGWPASSAIGLLSIAYLGAALLTAAVRVATCVRKSG
jgi:ACS family tartrate transporter-like MFS transporter